MFTFLPLIVNLVLLLTAANFAAAEEIQPGSQSANYFPAPESNLYCLMNGKEVEAAKVSPKTHKYISVKLENKKIIKKLKNKIKKSKDKKYINKIKRKIKLANIQTESANDMCKKEYVRLEAIKEFEKNCSIRLSPPETNIVENQAVDIDLTPKTNCEHPYEIKLLNSDLNGEIKIGSDHITYQASYGSYKERLVLQACYLGTRVCSTETSLIINVRKGEFVGKDNSAKKYRNLITYSEARHLISKLALNDFTILTEDLKESGFYNLEKIVNKLLDPTLTSEDLKKVLQIRRDGGLIDRGWVASPAIPLKDAFSNRLFSGDTFLDSKDTQRDAYLKLEEQMYRGYNSNTGVLHYSNHNATAATFTRQRFLSPTWELMANFWYAHFGTALHNYGEDRNGYFIRDYMSLISNNALGSFKELIVGSDPDKCLSSDIKHVLPDTVPINRGILCDAASQVWLDNINNTNRGKNQNFAREFMELYLLGPNDYFTGKPNYTEDDIAAATAFLSGYKLVSYDSTKNYGNTPNSKIYRENLIWDPALHDFSEYTLFRGTEYEFSGNMNPVQFTEYLLNNHPSVAKYITRKIYSMLVDPDPDAEFINQLALKFRENKYNIAFLIQQIATSEAFFSKKVKAPSCIKPPSMFLAQILRNFNIPLYPSGIHLDSIFHHHNTYAAVVNNLYSIMLNSGEKPLSYDTVFSHKYCGRQKGQIGEEWLSTSSMLSKIKGLINILNGASFSHYIGPQSWTGFFHMSELLHKLRNIKNDPGDITPDLVIDYFNDIYQIDLAENEVELIKMYLVNNLGSGNNLVPIDWDPKNLGLMNEKLSGLVVIYSSLSQANVN